MSRVVEATVITVLIWSAASVLLTLGVLAVRARVRYARTLSSFRCRVSPPAGGRREDRARWCLRRTWAAWVDDVLMIRTGALRLWLTPLPVGIAPDVTVEALAPGEVRGLGSHPVALRFSLRGAAQLEVAVAAEDADRLVGPFMTAAMSRLPDARPERGG